MTTSITASVATDRAFHQLGVATPRHRVRHSSLPTSAPPDAPTIVLRMAHEHESHVVRALAELDDARALDGPVLLAFIDGQAVAALSLRDGRVVANPFVLTEKAVSLLRLAAGHREHETPRRRRRAGLRLGSRS
jgi:hypothetical protein